MTIIDKEPVQRVQKILKKVETKSGVIVIKSSERTDLESANSLNC